MEPGQNLKRAGDVALDINQAWVGPQSEPYQITSLHKTTYYSSLE